MQTDKHIHILGICGTAMAAIASLAKEQGYRVTGSDSGIYPPMSDYLAALAIPVQAFDAANLLPAPDLCVIGNAMSRGNVEVEAILNKGLAYCSGPEFIGKHILPQRHAIVVAGTHGKTTTASLMAHVLECAGKKAGKGPGFMIGGIPEDFGGGARLGSGEHFVLEGDEYDTAFFDKRSKFLHYHARTLILNNLEFDHADIFADLEAIKVQFAHLLRTVPADGKIIVNADDENLADVIPRGCWSPVTRFARLGHADAPWQWQPLADDGTAFEILHQGQPFLSVSWNMLGIHNVSNACAVTAAAHVLGIERDIIAQALASFSGIRRRMTLVGEANGVRIFDDFAHHPTAINGVVAAAKHAMKSSGKLWVIVEPRSNTMRTRIHQQRLPASFEYADRVIFVPPSSRNLRPDEVLDADQVCRDIGTHASVLPDTNAIIDYLCAESHAGDVILILSNGGFDGIHQRLLDRLSRTPPYNN
ncbi:MAG: UDP-N-acetylmuramate:L-alanyl-gamma-D-glutamyl-meso-diaminopimelate ligase [Zetaproteobacteria bacterium CG_4_9_14_3_um_filter_49_83]|nr:MAG: UDP-N-acetylmuramate:L-alanyl-gamma-D-glutamyl-meso-diaminopimelate ligase [Zetaproteobacteria bacterium CG1_02_49_23]PIQ31534.1 MAG: UDP-N-acetylmuramate:L-alanyl-gamma-D-glutamyl-meso-diaminopimelate ligase [Zetaproteobacteria bacterium CG17_big_fil_post_rev_8_21_14_2_50_50_13]PIV31105.1 MAG: UDP-N-acetylmuramate:L-alanyl-gamma-D-glutamyl-meso-diaminopimelate ligase [Zetaproteobacteria bacterium CG02_land_8_20_14_3_00_50_9]PIY54587.1 MAG: UDP-N-acetylmuramate:L-alanyl-gamma-D-glutamyl-